VVEAVIGQRMECVLERIALAERIVAAPPYHLGLALKRTEAFADASEVFGQRRHRSDYGLSYPSGSLIFTLDPEEKRVLVLKFGIRLQIPKSLIRFHVDRNRYVLMSNEPLTVEFF